MTYFRKVSVVAILCLSFLFAGCGNNLPFSYRYTSPQDVIITYKGVDYHLSNNGEKNKNTPFTYEFEADGDIDLVVEGKKYEIDSPYDKDSSVKKVSKKNVSKKKKSTKSSKRK